jgi:hypothetical protein
MMSNRIRLVGMAPLAALLLGFAAQPAQSLTYLEVGDTGQLLGTAQAVGGGITTISGALGSPFDVDLFGVAFNAAGTITIDGIKTSGSWDPNLHLFNAAGNPLGANDDSNFTFDSQLVVSISPGFYYIGICDNNCEATDGGVVRIQSNDFGVQLANGILGGWSASGNRTGAYEIRFSVATEAVDTPEPASLALVLTGALALTAARRRRR